MLLPIHKTSWGQRKVTHFIAVQKDVTFLRKTETHPREWSTVEVALWLESLGLAKYGESFISQKIDGEHLVSYTDRETLLRLGVADDVHQNIILKHAAMFREGYQPKLYSTLKEGILALSTPSDRYKKSLIGKADEQLAVAPKTLDKDFWVTQQERQKINELGIALKYVFSSPLFLCVYCIFMYLPMMTIKHYRCTYKGTTAILLIRTNTSFDKLMQRIYSLFKGPFVLHVYIEHEGDNMQIRNDQDLRNAFALAQGNTITVRLEQRYFYIRAKKKKETL